MDRFVYKPLDPLTRSADSIRSNMDRKKEVYINGEKWYYNYFCGNLSNLSKTETFSQQEDDYSKGYKRKTIEFDKETKTPYKCTEEEQYWDGYKFVKNSEYLEYLIDEYGNNVQDIIKENWNIGTRVGTQQYFCINCGNLERIEHFDEYGNPINKHIVYFCHRADKEKSLCKVSIFNNGYNEYEVTEYYDNYEYISFDFERDIFSEYEKKSEYQVIKSEGKYFGKNCGKVLNYNENGILQEEINLQHGIKHGVYKRFSNEGVLVESGEYLDGEKVGNWVTNIEEINREKRELEKYSDDDYDY